MIKFLSTIIQDEDGTGSMSRVFGLVAILAVIGWVTHVVYHTHTIPDLTSVSYFVSSSSIPYAANKIHNAVITNKTN